MSIKKISGDFDGWLEEQLQKRIAKLITAMCYVGEQCINEARNNGDYIDRTGNLRSSIGYVVLNNGNAVKQAGFKKYKKGSYGKAEGEALLQDLMTKYTKGIVLIVVAGMNYASYVESLGRNVLTSSELMAKREVPRMLRDLGLAA